MDATLNKRLKDAANELPDGTQQVNIEIERVNDATGEVTLIHGDQQEPYTLKPLAELYGPGSGKTVDAQNDIFMSLFLSIEEEIVRFDSNEELLSDGRVALVLNGLSLNPEAPATDALAQQIQAALRLNLSINDYSRQEVRQALRKIEKSVARHAGAHGRGYIDFIHKFFGRLRK